MGPVLFILYTQPLSDIIQSHSVSHHVYADDTELYKSSSPENVSPLLTSVQRCAQDVKEWTLRNKLQLNEDKTEALLIDPSSISTEPPSSITVGDNDIPFSDSARNLGVMFDNSLSMNVQINKLCQAGYLELRRISSIRHYLTREATATLVSSLVLSRLDYANSLLAGLPQKCTDKLQRVMNCAARLIYRSSKRDHITPLLSELYWLPISKNSVQNRSYLFQYNIKHCPSIP